MVSIHPEVQDFVDEDETNYETDEINKENMNEFWIFIKIIHKTIKSNEDEINYEINKVNMNEFWIFIADQKSGKYIAYRSAHRGGGATGAPKKFNGEFAKSRRL